MSRILNIMSAGGEGINASDKTNELGHGAIGEGNKTI
jgi:hypothetical protein